MVKDKQIATERLFKTFCRFGIAKPKEPSLSELLDQLTAALAANVYSGTGLGFQFEGLDATLKKVTFDDKSLLK